LPLAYRQVREARRLSSADAQALDELVRDVATPAAAWKTTMMWVGYVVGVLTVVVLAIGALVGAVAGLFAADKLGDKLTTVLVAIFAVGGGLISVPFVGEVLVHLVALRDLDRAIEFATSGVMDLRVEAGVGLVLYVFSVVPIALARRTQVSLQTVEALRVELTAKRKLLRGSVLECRSCGAPLTVSAGALMARCSYCGTDSLVAVTASDAVRVNFLAQGSHRAAEYAVGEWKQARAADRDLMLKLLVGGPALVPLVCLGGGLLHVIMA
jgi:LSD1 subclass zinc finger protein